MKIFLLIVFTALTCFVFPQNTGKFTSAEINYPQSIFDSDTCCWRKLSKEKKYQEASNLIVTYLDKCKVIRNRHSLNWHAGQMFALANDYKNAKKYFRRTYSIFYQWFGGVDGKTWYYYAKGTVAFLNGNKKELELIIKNWRERFAADTNYEALVKLLKNWDKSYEDATKN